MGKINRRKHGRSHSSCVSHPLSPPPQTSVRMHVFTLLQVGISTTEKYTASILRRTELVIFDDHFP